MKKKIAKAVIGAGFGDEGKGLMTDILATQGADVVVRTNGGAQAGHTVETPEGARHVFHHFCSGALAGVSSHLSSFFVSHPMMFMEELDSLQSLGGNVRITADPRGLLTTPYDMMINQFIETRRGTARHGSCGVGFGEVIERSLRGEYALRIDDLFEGRDVRLLLESIRTEWVSTRLSVLGGGDLTEREQSLVYNDAILDRFVEDLQAFRDVIGLRRDADLDGQVIFEGAQGLMLDQDYGFFPHVTRSNTGILNMSKVAAEAGIEEIDAHYMTRSYVTRHGAGLLPHEGDDMGYVDIVDPTNIPNDWQGTIRSAPLDVKELRKAIRTDIMTAEAGVRINPDLVITCIDQLVSKPTVYNGYDLIDVEIDDYAGVIGELTGMDIVGTSWGPTRAGFREENVFNSVPAM